MILVSVFIVAWLLLFSGAFNFKKVLMTLCYGSPHESKIL